MKIGDKIKLDDDGVIRTYTVTKPGMRHPSERLKENEVYLTSPGVMGFDASIDWVNQNMIHDKMDKGGGVGQSKIKTSKDKDGNSIGKYLDLDFKIYNLKEGWVYDIYYYSPIMEQQETYSSDKDHSSFRTKKSAIDSIKETIEDIKESNDKFTKSREQRNEKFKDGGNMKNTHMMKRGGGFGSSFVPNYPSFSITKGLSHNGNFLNPGYYTYMNKEVYGKGLYMNVNNRQTMGFSIDDLKIIKRNNPDSISVDLSNLENGGKMEDGGVIGQEIVFDDNGEENTGVIKDIHEITGNYIVATDDGRTVLADKELDVISLGKIREAKAKKRFSFFEDGGKIEKSDIEYTLRLAIEDNGINPISLKSVKKIGNKYQITVSSYISEEFANQIIADMNHSLKTTFSIINGSYQKTLSGNKSFQILQLKMEDGGNIAKENNDMLHSQAKEAKHHIEELHNILTSKTKVEPWVVAKMTRAKTDLSDITHYLDGNTSKMAKGGKLTDAQQEKFNKVMHEWKQGKLHSGSPNGPIVKDQDQAIAIAYAEAYGSDKMLFGGMVNDLSDDTIDRMEGLVPISTLQELLDNAKFIIADMYEEGFEKDEIVSFLAYKISQIGGNKMANGGGVGASYYDLLGGSEPFTNSEMKSNVVEPNLGPNFETIMMFDENSNLNPKYNELKAKYPDEITKDWQLIYRSSNYQGYAEISPNRKVIKAAILNGGGIKGVFYVKSTSKQKMETGGDIEKFVVGEKYFYTDKENRVTVVVQIKSIDKANNMLEVVALTNSKNGIYFKGSRFYITKKDLNNIKEYVQLATGGSIDSLKKGDIYEWHTVEYDSKKGNNYKVVKKVEITDIRNHDVIGRLVGTSNEFIIREPNKYLKNKVSSKMAIGGKVGEKLADKLERETGIKILSDVKYGDKKGYWFVSRIWAPSDYGSLEKGLSIELTQGKTTSHFTVMDENGNLTNIAKKLKLVNRKKPTAGKMETGGKMSGWKHKSK